MSETNRRERHEDADQGEAAAAAASPPATRRLFFRTFLAFSSALLILIGVMAGMYALGLRRSLEAWERRKDAAVEDAARSVLAGDREAGAPEAGTTDDAFADLVDVPLFVYDKNRDLVYSNRGRGRRLAEQRGGADLTPVASGGDIIGYYYATRAHFRDDAANRRLLASLGRTLWISVLSSLLIALGASYLFSRTLAAPAERIAAGLDRLLEGDYDLSASAGNLPSRVAVEMSRIALATDRLARRLSHERTLRNQWAHDVAHDLRTPISVLRAQLEAMRDGVLDVTPGRFEKNIHEISRIETLISDLEELMSLEAPERRITPRPIDPGELIDSMRARFAAELLRKRAAFDGTVRIDSFTADPGLIERAMFNLLSNAARHVEEGGTVSVTVSPADEEGIEIRVHNTGETVPEAERERVFDRLYRGEYARGSAGSGLGLTIARRIAELHGGAIRMEGGPEGGTTVVITLPKRSPA